MPAPKRDQPFPYAVNTAVIGAGVAGLYASFRLSTASSSNIPRSTRSVAVFESSDRIGGRLCTARHATGDPVVDVGGMRFHTSQHLLFSLVSNVLSSDPDTELVKFPDAAPRSTIFHLRDRTFSLEDARDVKKSPQVSAFGLPECWRGMSPGDVLFSIIHEVLAADGFSTLPVDNSPSAHLRMWDKVKRTARYCFDGPFYNRFLHEITMYQVVLDRYGLATFNYLRDGLGFDSNVSWVAAEVFEQYACGMSNEEPHLTLKGGMETIASTLCERTKVAGGEIFTHARLQSFDRYEQPGFRYALRMVDELSGANVTVLTNNIILAVPRQTLEVLQPSFTTIGGVDVGRHFATQLRSVGSIPAVKIVMWFDEPWWTASFGLTASVTTDLPLRMCYLFGSADPDTRSVIIATYADMETTHFWKSLQALGRRASTSHTDGGLQTAQEVVVAEVMRELRVIFGETTVTGPPSKSLIRVWDGERNGDVTGYHFWKAGCEVWKIAARMRQPIENEKIFVCGEAYSDRHSWVEGSLCTTEHVMRNQFGLQPPEWLDRDECGNDYYLGW